MFYSSVIVLTVDTVWDTERHRPTKSNEIKQDKSDFTVNTSTALLFLVLN